MFDQRLLKLSLSRRKLSALIPGATLTRALKPAPPRIVAANLRALQPLHAAAMLERAELFSAADRSADLFARGKFSLRAKSAQALLQNYLMNNQQQHLSQRDRAALYARAFGFGAGTEDTLANREFDALWLRFVSSVSAFARQSSAHDLLVARAAAAKEVQNAARALALNCSLHGAGAIRLAAIRLQAQLLDALALVSNKSILKAFGASTPWELIEKIAAQELGVRPELARARTLASSGGAILTWLASNATRLRRDTAPVGRTLIDAAGQWLDATSEVDETVSA